MIRKTRRFAGRLVNSLRLRLRSGGRLERALYYGVFSDAFRREREVVAHGHRAYTEKESRGTQEFLLRRNIHMLEKGLTMRPRRDVFAVEYIGATVRLFQSMTKPERPLVSTSVQTWAREVLEQYFDVTAASNDPTIAAARTGFASVVWQDVSPGSSGPHHPDVGPSPVSIDDLTDLARRRKSVRWFMPRPVPREFLDRAMLVAREAPSACNRQPFRFEVFDDPSAVEKVAKVPMGTAGYGHNLPGIVVIVGDLSAFIDERDRLLIYTDGCLAAMSFILGLEAQGIASVCINWPDIIERDKRMAALLQLEPHERVVMLIGYGYADPEGLTPFSAKRRLEDLRSFSEL